MSGPVTVPAWNPSSGRAQRADVPAMVAMLADDPLGALREQPGDPAYLAAFDALDADPNQLLVVAELAGEASARSS